VIGAVQQIALVDPVAHIKGPVAADSQHVDDSSRPYQASSRKPSPSAVIKARMAAGMIMAIKLHESAAASYVWCSFVKVQSMKAVIKLNATLKNNRYKPWWEVKTSR